MLSRNKNKSKKSYIKSQNNSKHFLLSNRSCAFDGEYFKDKLFAKVVYNADTGRAYKVNS